MARYSIDGSVLDNIANAINEKTGETAAMVPGEMAEKIAGIPGGREVIWKFTKTGTIDGKNYGVHIADMGNITAQEESDFCSFCRILKEDIWPKIFKQHILVGAYVCELTKDGKSQKGYMRIKRDFDGRGAFDGVMCVFPGYNTGQYSLSCDPDNTISIPIIKLFSGTGFSSSVSGGGTGISIDLYSEKVLTIAEYNEMTTI